MLVVINSLLYIKQIQLRAKLVQVQHVEAIKVIVVRILVRVWNRVPFKQHLKLYMRWEAECSSLVRCQVL